MTEFRRTPFDPETQPETGVEPKPPLTAEEAYYVARVLGPAIVKAEAVIELVEE